MTGPAWLSPLPDAEQMRALDRWAIEERRVPSLDLMERAGEGLVAVTEDVAPDGLVVVVCGPGNNGGDGYVAARIWRSRGRPVRVLTVGEPRTDDAIVNAARLPEDCIAPFQPAGMDGAAVIVDALLGTGTSGAPREEFATAIAAINASGVPVVSADVPSGVDASTGEVTQAVDATATATFAHAKAGLWIAPGKRRAGRVEVVDIGIPRGGPVGDTAGLIESPVVDGLAGRGVASTKFSAGRVFVAGGSPGLTGAVCLAAEAAARAGAGYVTALVPQTLGSIFEIKLLEPMTVGLADEGGVLGKEAANQALALIEHGVLVLGSGLGRDAAAFTRPLAQVDVPLVLDADGLNAYAGDLPAIAGREAPTILTPHAGELARLLGVRSEDIEARRLHHVRLAADLAQAIVVLKGDDTLIARPDGQVAIGRGGSPALATAGTGDVLAGVIGALLAAGTEPTHAVCAAVTIHAEAGRLAAERVGDVSGVIAGDVIAALPTARNVLASR